MNVEKPSPIRAIVLLSGGLDSQLAAQVLRRQNVEVMGLTFESPFFGSESGRRAAAQLGVELRVLDFTCDIIELLECPKHGFGSCMNPCVDCHARMLKRAGRVAEEEGFHFLATGEVLNERPMSQNKRSLQIVARDSGYPDLVVRPLSAKLLPPTRPEREGWLDRERLLDLHGRSRKPQFRLAEELGVKEYPAPAGGCKLTEPHFCARLKDLRDHEGLRDVRLLKLLRLGRHFRLATGARLVVGRNERENVAIEALAVASDLTLGFGAIPGPSALLVGGASAAPEITRQAAAICARYADTPEQQAVAVEVRRGEQWSRVDVVPAEDELVRACMRG
jgi:tRNA U34 2-thiouridine synthase MnmA/TrmU